jgi:hypothetical protein
MFNSTRLSRVHTSEPVAEDEEGPERIAGYTPGYAGSATDTVVSEESVGSASTTSTWMPHTPAPSLLSPQDAGERRDSHAPHATDSSSVLRAPSGGSSFRPSWFVDGGKAGLGKGGLGAIHEAPHAEEEHADAAEQQVYEPPARSPSPPPSREPSLLVASWSGR